MNACSTAPPEGGVPLGPTVAHRAVPDQPELLERWKMVEQVPPTFHPKGWPSSAPTTQRDGEWVSAHNGGGLWFIPFDDVDGIPREDRFKEARAWRNEVQKIHERQRREKNPAELTGEILAKTAIIAFGVVLGVAGGGNGGAVLEDLWEAASE